MNLVFRTVQGDHKVAFPLQTPTDLTYAVLAEPSIEKQLSLIEQWILEFEWTDEEIDERMLEIEDLMRDPTLKLEMV
jgi:hypothetical protein